MSFVRGARLGEQAEDSRGRITTMKTWQDFSGNGLTATTRWNYGAYRGWLSYKEFPIGTTGVPPEGQTTNGPSYSYTSAGRLKTRTWVRGGGLTTYYTNNAAGDLYTLSHSD
jgi:hypothetical protein